MTADEAEELRRHAGFLHRNLDSRHFRSSERTLETYIGTDWESTDQTNMVSLCVGELPPLATLGR